jgi:hypothetical protein
MSPSWPRKSNSRTCSWRKRASVIGTLHSGSTPRRLEAGPHRAFIDSWEVTEGTAGTGVLGLTVPLVRGDGVRVDLEVEAGLRALSAT